MRSCRAVAIAFLLPACFSCGCGSDPLGRNPLSGTVSLDGAPLAKGNLSLQPTEQQPTSGGAVISNGRYTIPRDQGLVAGKYRVSINAAGERPGLSETAVPGEPPPPPKELIPPEWNTASEHFIEVKKEGPFVFDFEVRTKKK